MKYVQPVPLYALLLSGGKSERMGSDKNWIEYFDIPQYQYVTKLLESLVDKVYISVRLHQEIPYPHLITDKYKDLGPFGGILTALETYPNASFLVVAIDLPFLNSENLKNLIALRDISGKATAFYNIEKGFYEPLACIWESSILPDLQASFRNQIYKPTRVLELVEAKKVPLDTYFLQNINTPEEYQQSLELLKKHSN